MTDIGVDEVLNAGRPVRDLATLSAWADSIVFACNEGLRYERWWEARLPIEEIRSQYRAEQIEKGIEPLRFVRI
jgi:hypothetical protein